MKVKLFALLLATLLPVGAWADVWQDPETKVNYEYTPGKSEASVVAGTDSGADSPDATGDITILSSFTVDGNDYTVTSIGSQAFEGCSSLTFVTIPESVTSIGDSAFKYCSGLTSITIPNSVTSIGGSTFAGCSGLASVTIGNSVTSIGVGAFWGCRGLTSVTIPNSVTIIEGGAFQGCSSLTSIDIPNSVTSIGIRAFLGCGSLTSVTIGNSVTSIGNEAFESCWSLTSIIIGNSVTNVGESAFAACSGLTSITIPESVTSIGESAFAACTGLTSITIPGSVTSIGEQAFYNCRSLTEVSSLITEPFAINANCWESVNKEIPLYVPKGTKEKYETTEGWNYFTNIFEMEGEAPVGNIAFADYKVKAVCIMNWDTDGDGELSHDEAAAVTDLGEAFKNNRNITSFNELLYFTGLTDIGDYAFYDCKSLSSITIPNSVTSIGEWAFRGCSGLTSIKVEEGNTVYDSRDNCNAIIEIETDELIVGCKNTVIPNSVTSISGWAFMDCSRLFSITIPNSVMSIQGNPFQGCIGLTSIKVEEGNTVYDSRDNCNAIIETETNELISGCKNTVIPNSVTSIGAAAFERCSSLISVTIPNSMTSIGDRAFFACSGLTSVTIPNSVTSIGAAAFDNCSGLTAVTIGNSVTSIGDHAFYFCKALTSVTIPNSVTSIERYAFSYCSGLTEVRTLITEPFTINADCWNGVNKNILLYVPKGTKEKYEATEGWNYFANIIEMEEEAPTGNIAFADYNVKAICVTKWDTDGDGELSYDEAAAVTDLGDAFEFNGDITSFDELQYFTGLTSIGQGAFYECTGLTTVTIPNFVTGIESFAFSGCSGLASVTIPNSVTSIESNAFSDCSGLTSVTIPNSVTSIGERAFDSCSGLTSIKVEEGNTVYDSRDNCNAIINTETNELILGCKNTVIPNSVTSIGGYIFSGCSGLTSIDIPNSVTSIGWYAFYGCSGLTSVTIGNSVTSIGQAAFYDCTSLTSVTIPNSVTSIEYGGFADCTGLTSIKVEEGNTVYDSRGNCNAIIETATNKLIIGCKNTVIPNSVTSIGGGAFEGYRSLASITIPSSVTSIGDWAFGNCSGLTSVTIPNSVTSIEQCAFYGCTGLQEVYSLIEEPFSINTSVFKYYDNGNKFTDATLYVPKGTKEKYQSTDGWNYFTNIIEMEDLEPEDGGEKNYGNGGDITADTDLNGVVVDNMFYNIGTDAGGYNSEEGCIVITKETSDEQMEQLKGLGISDAELQQNFTGIIFKVPAGKGTVKVTAETTGNMTLKVKVGNGQVVEMELSGRLKMKFPYDVSEESLVYIFAGTTDESGVRGAAEEPSSLKIYGIEWTSASIKGDLNGDGNVDVGDIMAVINIMASSLNPPEGGMNGDINGDGNVDVGDIMAIINIMAGK